MSWIRRTRVDGDGWDFNRPAIGSVLIYQGKVIEKKEEGGRRYVVVEFFAENQKGEKVVVGTARAAF